MHLAKSQPLITGYSVEVSGWDDKDTFFVENTELWWNEESGKLLTLSCQLRPGAIIFVRLLQPMDAERSFPVPYEAEPVLSTFPEIRQFRLKRMFPQAISKEGA